MSIPASELAKKIHAQLDGEGKLAIKRCAPIAAAEAHDLVLVLTAEDLAALGASKAGAVLTTPLMARAMAGQVVMTSANPNLSFRQALVELHGFREHPEPGISPDAYVDPSAIIGELCTIRPFANVSKQARVGKRAVIYPHCYVGKNTTLGDDCVIYPNVVIYDGCVIGNRVVIHAGTVIGHDASDFVEHEGRRLRIPSAGNVVIEDDVEIGAGATIQRAIVGCTRIGKGARLADHAAVTEGSCIN